MAPFRPTSLNKRNTSITGGNGGVIGTTRTPYLCKAFETGLGQRCFMGCNGGVFSITESYNGSIECCSTAVTDCLGFLICSSGPGSTKWFVAPCCAEVVRSWYTRDDAVTVANSCMGSCGWFIPSCSQLINPGSCCFRFWDCCCCNGYWSSTQNIGYNAWHVFVPSGSPSLGGPGDHIKKPAYRKVRAFRTVTI